MQIFFRHGDTHLDNLRHTVGLFKTLESLPDGSTFEIPSTGFATPLQLVPLVCLIKNKELKPLISAPNSNIAGYLEAVYFPNGVNAGEAIPGRSGNYIPIAGLPDLKERADSKEVEFRDIESNYRELILGCYPNIRNNLADVISFFLSELIENAKDHADADNFYIFAQYWPRLNEFELCLMDDGIGLLGSLSKKYEHVNSHETAMREVVQRKLSSRINELEALSGSGIANTIKITGGESLKSSFTMFSGNCGYSNQKGIVNWIGLGTLHIPGVLINIRVKVPPTTVNVLDYVS